MHKKQSAVLFFFILLHILKIKLQNVPNNHTETEICTNTDKIKTYTSSDDVLAKGKVFINIIITIISDTAERRSTLMTMT